MSQVIQTKGTFNFRDFGGYGTKTHQKVRSSVLLRSASLDKIANPEAQRLQASLGIQTIIDLRHPDEFTDSLTRGSLVDLVKDRHALSVIDTNRKLKDQTNELDTTYGFGQSGPRYFALLERGELIWREIFRILLEPASYPVLTHCTAGKDRTGITAALILDLMGVDQNTISEDYAFSSKSIDQLFDHLVDAGRRPDGDMETVKSRMVSNRKYMDDFLTLLYQRYGNSEGYIKNLGFNQADVARIRKFLLI